MQALLQYVWPGNIRELENICKRYVIVGDATQIVREISVHIGRAPQGSAASTSDIELRASSSPSLLDIGHKAAWEAERRAILEMLAETHWNRREAARRLRVSYKALLNKISRIESEQGMP